MNKRLLIVVIIIAVVAGIAIGYVRGLPNDFDAAPLPIDYGYRCGDGTEFTLYPTPLLVTLHVVPASSVDYIREQDLTRHSEFLFTSSDTTLVDSGDVLTLAVRGHATTTCNPMFPADQSFF